jgi:proteasome lid subunit RPN8/RPN11
MFSPSARSESEGASPPGRPGDHTEHDQRRPGSLPLDRATYWYPTAPPHPAHRANGYPRFITVGALQEIAVHLSTRADDGQLGFLMGELHSCPDTGADYVVIDGIVPTPYPLKDDRTTPLVVLARPRLQERLSTRRRRLLGWYHTHPDGGLGLTKADIATHQRFFGESWQVAIVLEYGSERPRGIVCQPSADKPGATVALPFYEFRETGASLADRSEPAAIDWPGYSRGSLEPQPERPGAPTGPPARPYPAPRPGARAAAPRVLEYSYEGRERASRRPLTGGRIAAALTLMALAVVAIWKLGPLIELPRSEPPQLDPIVLEAMDPAVERLDLLADDAAAALRRYRNVVRRVEGMRYSCVELARAFDRAVEAWTAYETEGHAKAGKLDELRILRDEELYAQMIQVGSHFRTAGCRPQ